MKVIQTTSGRDTFVIWVVVLAAIFLLSLIFGCAEAPKKTERPVCVLPPAPIFPMDNVTGRENLMSTVIKLWEDREARSEYEAQLRDAIQKCQRTLVH